MALLCLACFTLAASFLLNCDQVATSAMCPQKNAPAEAAAEPLAAALPVDSPGPRLLPLLLLLL
eukprot:CAMPEP_0115738152 /NCGR_PEP_ID=MMETSP0272-20121206/88227_1 /TAXON_ID=71861 /ORGANISM="Scrippsiella trochoidea, Strain CCMP3099" /LENGTH=63 /DNA_ID=CAMNT_0003182559 /DNA_START=22 /DNA_END=210 /DNA_ORIENTATION=+